LDPQRGPDPMSATAPLTATPPTATPLERIRILEPRHPNRSTGIINGRTSGILNWNDIPYPSFYRAYNKLSTNFWIPDEVDMKGDAHQYGALTAREKYAFDSIIGMLAKLHSPHTHVICNVAEYISESAAHANAAIIGQQEVIHNESYSYVLASITDLANQKRIFEIARTHPTILRRNAPIMGSYDDFMREKTAETLLRALIQSSILEGINFYS